MRTRFVQLAVAVLVLASVAFAADAGEKKVLFIDSYHAGYSWSDGVVKGAKSVLGDQVELKIIHMDTKRNTSEEFKKQAAEKAKAVIDEFQPDVVIAADDNASKFLIAPYYKGKDLPFVFCGVNWDCSGYGFPAENVTGMIEVSLADKLIEQLKKYAKGDKVAFLAVDNTTARKEGQYNKEKLGITFAQEVYVSSVDEWKAKFKELQGSVDIVILDNNAGLNDWDDAAMKAFHAENTSVPTGSIYDWIAPYVLLSYTKDAAEQGEWAAAQALRILEGTSPAAIEVAQNKKAKIFLNLPLAKQLGVNFPLAMMKRAEIIKK
ncbi:MAG: ABC transporter substrate-binding protein [Planctomycetota bacterium]